MNSTAERAKIAFISKEHEKFYNESLRMVRYQDEYHNYAKLEGIGGDVQDWIYLV